MNRHFLLHIPHSSTIIPKEFRLSFVSDPDENLRFMTDWYTDELFDIPMPKIVFPVSRLICDVERFRDDSTEEMSLRGMGVCYTHGYDGNPLRCFNAKEKEYILRRWYDPHHTRLAATVDDHLEKYGECTVIDCHSFSARPLPYEPNRSPNRPNICIGTDEYHTPLELIDHFIRGFRKKGYSVAVNFPYAGTIVPIKHYKKDRRVYSVMIEINRRLYLNENCEKNTHFSQIKNDIFDVVSACRI